MSADAPQDPTGADGPRNRIGAADEPRDPWLRAALRHAPDASTTAPTPLSDAILKAARSGAAAVSSTRSASSPRPSFGALIGAAWDWLGRAPVAAGFASVLAATLVGLLWWDRPLDEAMPEANRQPPAAKTPAQPYAPATPPQEQARSDNAAAPGPAPMAGIDRPSTTNPAAQRDAPAPLRAPAERDAKIRSEAQRGAAAADALESQGALRNRVDKAQPSAATAPSAAPAPRAFPTPPNVGVEPRALRKDADPGVLDRSAASPETSARAEAAAPARQSSTDLREPAAAANAPSIAPADPASALSTLLAAIDAAPERWIWQREGAEPRPLDAPMRRWLALLESMLASARPQGAAPAPPATASRPLVTLRLLRDGLLQTTLQIDAQAATAESAADPSASWRQALEAGGAIRLQRALPSQSR